MSDEINKSIKSGTQALMKALEAGMYSSVSPIAAYAPDKYTCGLLQTFTRLGLSKADWMMGGALKYEGLDATLKSVTFDAKDLKQWKDIGKK